MVAFDRYTINTLYELPHIENDEYHAMINDHYNCDEILPELTEEGAEWSMNRTEHVSFKSKYLKRTPYLWLKFISARLIPSGHTTTVTRERALLLFTIMRRMTIDVRQLIQSQILHAVSGRTTGGLPFPGLITELCSLANVQWGPGEEKVKPLALVDVLDRQPVHSRAAVRRITAGPSTSSSQRHQAGGIEQRLDRMMVQQELMMQQQQQMMQQQQQIMQRVDHLQANTDAFMTFATDVYSAFRHYYPTPDGDGPQWPTPPTWPRRNDDDNDY